MICIIKRWIIQTPYLSALNFWHSLAWNFKFDELDFFPSLNWIFAGYSDSKNPIHQTWYFKLENVKNQVQIDRGTVPFNEYLSIFFRFSYCKCLDWSYGWSLFELRSLPTVCSIFGMGHWAIFCEYCRFLLQLNE